MKRMVIKGSEWHRGSKMEFGDAGLLNKEGRMCCLGIHGRLCGVSDELLLVATYPENLVWGDIPECYQPWVAGAFQRDRFPVASRRGIHAVGINDEVETTDAEKIAKLRPIFAEIGVSIVWRPDL